MLELNEVNKVKDSGTLYNKHVNDDNEDDTNRFDIAKR